LSARYSTPQRRKICARVPNLDSSVAEFTRSRTLDSTYRKYRKIGEDSGRLLPFVDRLPSAWTTIHRLATLKPEKLELVINSPLFTPMMTAKQLNEITAGVRAKPDDSDSEEDSDDETPLKSEITITLSALELSVRLDVYLEVKALQDRFGFELTASDDLTEPPNGTKPARATTEGHEARA
jgi:hypothetical protein